MRMESRSPYTGRLRRVFLAAALAGGCGQAAAPTQEWSAASSGERPAADRPLEGFGALTPGGEGGADYLVTSLADSGPGTLRDALSASGRTVRFAVGGTLELQSGISISGHHVTVDGRTAPPPGITLTAAHPGVASALLQLRGAHDVILRDLRIQDAPDPATGDNLRIWEGAHDVVVDHCSFRRPGDGNLDISDGAHDITVQWCILAEAVRNQLIRTDATRISLHHNLYVHGDERNPQVDANSLVIDMRNNVVYDWAGNYGTRFRNGSTGNLVRNVWLAGPRSDAADAVLLGISADPVCLVNNLLPPACGARSTRNFPHAAPRVTEWPPAAALAQVLLEAGARPRDEEDAGYAADVDAGR